VLAAKHGEAGKKELSVADARLGPLRPPRAEERPEAPGKTGRPLSRALLPEIHSTTSPPSPPRVYLLGLEISKLRSMFLGHAPCRRRASDEPPIGF